MEIEITKQIKHNFRELNPGYKMIVTTELGLMWIKEGWAKRTKGVVEEEQRLIRENVKEEKTEIHIHLNEEE